ncbi:hypothetical protein [Streptomyces sp. NPDC057690]
MTARRTAVRSASRQVTPAANGHRRRAAAPEEPAATTYCVTAAR